MPIYEFQCQKCQHSFEELVFGRVTPPCPRCGGKETDKLISRPARSKRKGSSSDFGDSGDFGDPGDFGDSGASSCASCGGGDCASCGH